MAKTVNVNATTDPAAKTATMTITTPDGRQSICTGTVERLREFIDTLVTSVSAMTTQGALQDFRVEMRRVLVEVEKEFAK